MDNAFRVTKVQRIRNSEHNISDLFLCRQAVQISIRVELSPLTVLHDNVEVSGVVVDFIDFDYVRMFKLSNANSTKSMISHSFMYILRSCAFIFFLNVCGCTCR